MNSNVIKILMVEDNEDDFIIVRDVLRDALSRPLRDSSECFKLVWAETYHEGLQALEEWVPDAILLDYFLDVGNGLQWLSEARAAGHCSPVILMTGQGDHGIDVQAMQAGVDDYIVKDQISGALLERTLRYAIERARTARALRDSESRYRTLFETNPQPSWVYDCISLRFLAVNRAAIEHYGYSREEFAAFTLRDIRRPEDVGELMAQVQAITEAKKQGKQNWSQNDLVITHRKKDGSLIQVEMSASDLQFDGHDARLVVINDVTASQQAAESLRQSEERYRSLTEATSALVWNTPQLGVFLAPQPSWSAFTGQNWPQMQGEGWLEAVHPDDREQTLHDWAAATAERGACRSFHRLKRSDGEWVYMVVRAVPILDEQGEIREWVGAHTDVNERTLAEIALRQGKERYRSLVRAASQIVWTVAFPDSVMTSLDWMEYTGQTAAQMQRFGWIAAIHPDDREPTKQLWHSAVENKDICVGEYRLRGADGVYRSFETRAVPILDASGQIREWVGMTSDISARKSAEAERDRFFTVSLDLMCIGTAEGFLKRINPAFERVLGYSTAEIMAQSCLELVHPDDREMTARVLEHHVKSDHHKQFVNRYRCKNGSYRWFSWTAAWHDGLCYATARDVTDLKAAEAGLQRSLSLLQATLEATADGILVVDGEGEITHYNRKFLKLWGLDEAASPEAASPEAASPEGELHDAGNQAARRRILALIRAQLSEPEGFLQPSDSTMPSVSDYQLLPLADGRSFACYSQPQTLGTETLGRVWSFRDISHRLQAAAIQEELSAQVQQERQRLDDILANVPGLVWERYFGEFGLETARRRNYVSRYVQTLLGYSPQEWLESPTFWQDVMHPDDSELAQKNRAEIATSGHGSVLQYRMITKNGETIWGESNCGPIFDESGQVVGLRGVTMDISARIQAGQEQARLAMLLENTSDFVSWADMQGQVQYLNPAGRAMLGVGPDEDITALAVSEMHPAWANHRIEAQGIPQAMAGGVWTGETAILARDEREIPVSQVVMAPRDERGEVLFFSTICRDVSAQKEFEAQLQRANEELEARVARRTAELQGANHELSLAKEEADAANRAKSEFLSRMSHELRTPLNAILGFGQILEMREMEEKDTGCVNQILKAGHHLLQLINEILDIARIEAGRLSLVPEALDIQEILQGSLDLVAPLAAKSDIELRFPAARTGQNRAVGQNQEIDEKPLVLADRQRLHQVLLNLLSNAIKYNVEGGSVTLSYKVVEAKTLELQAFETDENLFERRLRIEVSDTGMGLTPEDQMMVFVPFERLGLERTKIEGSGIGLALCQQLIHAMNGQIGVQSEVSQGSTFWIELPCAEPSPLNAAPDIDPLDIEALHLDALDIAFSQNLASDASAAKDILVPMGSVTDGAAPERMTERELAEVEPIEAIEEFEKIERIERIEEFEEVEASWLPPEIQQLIAAIRPATVLYIEDNLSNLRLIENLFLQAPQLQLLTATRGDIGLERARVHRPDLILLDVHLPGIWGGEVMAQLQKSPQTRDIPVVVLSADGTQTQIETLLAAGARQYLIKPLGIEALLQMVAQILGHAPQSLPLVAGQNR